VSGLWSWSDDTRYGGWNELVWFRAGWGWLNSELARKMMHADHREGNSSQSERRNRIIGGSSESCIHCIGTRTYNDGAEKRLESIGLLVHSLVQLRRMGSQSGL